MVAGSDVICMALLAVQPVALPLSQVLTTYTPYDNCLKAFLFIVLILLLLYSF